MGTDETFNTKAFVAEAVTRFGREGVRGSDWTWFQCMDRDDRAAFDRMLVSNGDSLAFEAGTAENRFRSYVRRLSKEGGQ